MWFPLTSLHRKSSSPILLLGLSILSQLARSDLVYFANSEYNAGEFGPGPNQSFVTANYTPSVWNFAQPLNRTQSTISSGYLFTAPRGFDTAQPGPLIYDNDGHLVWDGTSVIGETLVFQMETYLGEPHILTWSGTILGTGIGSGYILMFNSQYQRVARYTTNLTGVTGATLADFHETRITPNNSAVMTAYHISEMNLTAYGGPSTGYILDSVFQEINITSGETLFTWYASENVSPSECHNPLGSGGNTTGSAWDYFHINSIDFDDDGNWLISSRYCFALYYIDGNTGDIIWRMGGTNSSFAMGPGADYRYQHHARWLTKNDTYATITVFDDFGVANVPASRGLYLGINFTNMSVDLIQDFIPFNTTVSQSQGSVQLQPNGNFLVGWGYMPWASEYTPSGDLLWAGQFGVVGGNYNEGYRVLRYNWTGEPTAPPSMALAQSSENITTVYVSWNGDTRTNLWELLGAQDSSGSGAVSLCNESRNGFETAITLSKTVLGKYNYVAVRALGEGNTSIGISNFTTSGISVTTSAGDGATNGTTSAGDGAANGAAKLVTGAWGTIVAAVTVVMVLI